MENKPYIAMQLVPGLALDRAARAMSLSQKVQVMRDVAEAMHHAHSQGIIHRDLKPSNILVMRQAGSDGSVLYEPVVMDFGLARDSSDVAGLTASGDVLGTPAYMSPEQARGETRRLDARSDVYSLGATLYDIVVGKPPFDDQTVVNIILKVISAAAPPLRSHDPNLPEALELIVSKCLNKEPEQRYPSAKGLADDLQRFLRSQRVAARRLSYLYRLGFFARRNPALATLALALGLSLLGLLAFGIQSRVAAARKDRLARQEAELAQRLGQSVKDLEWLVRTAHLLPLHDAGREKRLVRERMAEIHAELARSGAQGAERLGAYVLGRGHLALQQWDAAHTQLRRAEALGYRDIELDYALGRVLGELYSRGLDEARRSGDRSFVQRRRQELEAQYLVPARGYLQKSRSLRTVSTSYTEALIDYYNQHYDAALLNAGQALAQQGWLYEALKLQGDVHLSRALDARDHGDQAQAERHFADAVRRYEEAAHIGHSDRLIYEALAETWIRQEEMDMYRGIDPSPKLTQALAAADRALEAAPQDSVGHTKKAFAYFFVMYFRQGQRKYSEATVFAGQVIESAQAALQTHPDDAFAYDAMGNAYSVLGVIAGGTSAENAQQFQKAIACLKKAISIIPRFAWAHNDLGTAYLYNGLLIQTEVAMVLSDLEASINEFNRAREIDPDYSNAVSNLGATLSERAALLAEQGQDPAADAMRVRVMSGQLSKSNIYMLSLGSLAKATLAEAVYGNYKGLDVQLTLTMAERYLHKLISMNDKMLEPHLQLAEIAWRRAAHALEHRQAIDAYVSTGRGHIQTCQAIAPASAECRSLAILLDMYAFVVSRDFKTSFAAYRKSIFPSLRQGWENEKNVPVLSNIAEAIVMSVRWQAEHGLDAPDELAAGLSLLARLLKITQSLPRAAALRGALLALAARRAADRVAKQQGYAAAWDSFERAFRGNPLLRRTFGDLAEEARRGRGG